MVLKMNTTMGKPNTRSSGMEVVSTVLRPLQPHRDELFNVSEEGFYLNTSNGFKKIINMKVSILQYFLPPPTSTALMIK
jgi:hypothetical protein